MKKIFFIALIVIISILSSLYIGSSYACSNTSFKYQKFWEENKHSHEMIHGYSPYLFSNDFRSHYWYTDEEEGHYVLGYTQKPLPTSLNIIEKGNSVLKDTSDILISSPALKRVPVEDKTVTAEKKDIVPQVNDSQNLPQLIKLHKWTFQSKELEEAVLLK